MRFSHEEKNISHRNKFPAKLRFLIFQRWRFTMVKALLKNTLKYFQERYRKKYFERPSLRGDFYSKIFAKRLNNTNVFFKCINADVKNTLFVLPVAKFNMKPRLKW